MALRVWPPICNPPSDSLHLGRVAPASTRAHNSKGACLRHEKTDDSPQPPHWRARGDHVPSPVLHCELAKDGSIDQTGVGAMDPPWAYPPCRPVVAPP
eukprot:2163876-Pleurochrysis_carterae.AAC.1